MKVPGLAAETVTGLDHGTCRPQLLADARHDEALASAANKHGLEELPFAAVGLQPGEACNGVSERQRMTDI